VIYTRVLVVRAGTRRLALTNTRNVPEFKIKHMSVCRHRIEGLFLEAQEKLALLVICLRRQPCSLYIEVRRRRGPLPALCIGELTNRAGI